MVRFAVPARITVEAPDEHEAVAKAHYLADATDRLRARGYDLAIIGAPEPAASEEPVVLCKECGGRRHDGAPCPSESGALA
jgi:hypothetical protein